MKRKIKFISTLSLVVILSSVGCGNKEADDNASKKNTTNATLEQEIMLDDTAYFNKYSQFYGNYITPLGVYSIYETPDSTIEYYTTNEYPGNEKYIQDLKNAYLDSKEKIQLFIDSLEKELQTDDEKLKELNKNIIDYGKKTISNIDEKLKKLDEIPKDAYQKSKEDFIKFVNESTKVEIDMKKDFEENVQKMKDMFTSGNNK